ncbi:MAG TPA: hypothetical protein VFT29_13160 [Gemmatimonadaceae bacterium]|nr:hypothetical protein [Gemmatimonadaceae bacterium]
MSRQRVVQATLLASALAVACERAAPPRGETGVETTRAPVLAPTATGTWAPELGQVLVVPTDSENTAAVVYPAELSARMVTAAPMTLVNAAGDTTSVQVAAVDSQQCGDAPVVRLAGSDTASWSVGLLGRSGALLRMDSIEALPTADSARLAVELVRMASALKTERESRFSGLPFAVIGAHLFQAAGRRVVVAHLARRVNIEASPLEERTLIIAERPSNAAADEPYSLAYSRRSEGTEDTAEHFDVLAAVQGQQSVLLLLARDQQALTDYEVLERANGQWRSRWSRKLAC